jgi:hypothetical protein
MNRHGAVLIEALVAIAILSVAGLSAIEYVVAVQEAHARSVTRERDLARAERLLTATVLLSQRELEQRLGIRSADDFLVWIDRPEPFLFRVGISAPERPKAELLATLVYRRDGDADASP